MKYHPYRACDEVTEKHGYEVFGDALLLLHSQALRLRCCAQLCVTCVCNEKTMLFLCAGRSARTSPPLDQSERVRA